MLGLSNTIPITSSGKLIYSVRTVVSLRERRQGLNGLSSDVFFLDLAVDFTGTPKICTS